MSGELIFGDSILHLSNGNAERVGYHGTGLAAWEYDYNKGTWKELYTILSPAELSVAWMKEVCRGYLSWSSHGTTKIIPFHLIAYIETFNEVKRAEC